MDASIKQAYSDEELMGLYVAGDFAAFEILYKRNSGRVFGYLKSKVSTEAAQDILQEIFIKLHKSRSTYNPQYPFLPWLFTIARNTLMDFYKLAETKLERSSISSETHLHGLEAMAEIPVSDVGLPEILESLPPGQKRAIELRYLQEWSFEQIASYMNTSEGNARKLISRGLSFVRTVGEGKKNEP